MELERNTSKGGKVIAAMVCIAFALTQSSAALAANVNEQFRRTKNTIIERGAPPLLPPALFAMQDVASRLEIKWGDLESVKSLKNSLVRMSNILLSEAGPGDEAIKNSLRNIRENAARLMSDDPSVKSKSMCEIQRELKLRLGDGSIEKLSKNVKEFRQDPTCKSKKHYIVEQASDILVMLDEQTKGLDAQKGEDINAWLLQANRDLGIIPDSIGQNIQKTEPQVQVVKPTEIVSQNPQPKPDKKAQKPAEVMKPVNPIAKRKGTEQVKRTEGIRSPRRRTIAPAEKKGAPSAVPSALNATASMTEQPATIQANPLGEVRKATFELDIVGSLAGYIREALPKENSVTGDNWQLFKPVDESTKLCDKFEEHLNNLTGYVLELGELTTNPEVTAGEVNAKLLDIDGEIGRAKETLRALAGKTEGSPIAQKKIDEVLGYFSGLSDKIAAMEETAGKIIDVKKAETAPTDDQLAALFDDATIGTADNTAVSAAGQPTVEELDRTFAEYENSLLLPRKKSSTVSTATAPEIKQPTAEELDRTLAEYENSLLPRGKSSSVSTTVAPAAKQPTKEKGTFGDRLPGGLNLGGQRI